MFSEIWPNCGSWKQANFFHMTFKKQPAQGGLLKVYVLRINESRIYRNRMISQEDSAVKTRLLWLMWTSTQLMGNYIWASSNLFTRRADDVIIEASFTAMTRDRHDLRAAVDLSMIAVALTPSWFAWILKVMLVRLRSKLGQFISFSR